MPYFAAQCASVGTAQHSPILPAEWQTVGSAQCRSQRSAKLSSFVSAVWSPHRSAEWSALWPAEHAAHQSAFCEAQWTALVKTQCSTERQSIDTTVCAPFRPAHHGAELTAQCPSYDAAFVSPDRTAFL